MKINGVKNIETGSVKRISVELDSEVTNGHTFCEMLIDEQNGRFTAVLYGGESYTFKCNDEDFIGLLIRELEDKDDWLYRQMRNARLDGVIDAEATTQALVHHIKESEVYKEDPTYYKEIEELEEEIGSILHDNSPFYTHTVWDVWDEWFESFISDGLLPNTTEMHDEGMELIKTEDDWKCRGFCEYVAPILAEVLKQEYQKVN